MERNTMNVIDLIWIQIVPILSVSYARRGQC